MFGYVLYATQNGSDGVLNMLIFAVYPSTKNSNSHDSDQGF